MIYSLGLGLGVSIYIHKGTPTPNHISFLIKNYKGILVYIYKGSGHIKKYILKKIQFYIGGIYTKISLLILIRDDIWIWGWGSGWGLVYIYIQGPQPQPQTPTPKPYIIPYQNYKGNFGVYI